MALEAGTYITDLVTANPPGSDGKSQGDDHLRLIKTVLKNTFPLAVGARKFSDVDAGATDTLTWLLYRNSATQAAADLLASYAVSGNSSTGVERVYARLQARADVVTNGAEFGSWLMKAMVNGVETTIGEFNSFRPITKQLFTAPGAATWNRPLGCRRVRFWGVAGGGGGGGVNGVTGATAGAGGGGGPGRWGVTPILDATLAATAALVIGAGGTGVSAAAGNSGGDTTVIFNAVTYTWKGGIGGQGCSMSVSQNQIIVGGADNGGTNLDFGGSSSNGGRGLSCGPDGTAVSGEGGSTPFGTGGYHRIALGAGALLFGIAGNNYGSGGSGAAGCSTVSDAAGGAGAGGELYAEEFY